MFRFIFSFSVLLDQFLMSTNYHFSKIYSMCSTKLCVTTNLKHKLILVYCDIVSTTSNYNKNDNKFQMDFLVFRNLLLESNFIIFLARVTVLFIPSVECYYCELNVSRFKYFANHFHVEFNNTQIHIQWQCYVCIILLLKFSMTTFRMNKRIYRIEISFRMRVGITFVLFISKIYCCAI